MNITDDDLIEVPVGQKIKVHDRLVVATKSNRCTLCALYDICQKHTLPLLCSWLRSDGNWINFQEVKE